MLRQAQAVFRCLIFRHKRERRRYRQLFLSFTPRALPCRDSSQQAGPPEAGKMPVVRRYAAAEAERAGTSAPRSRR